MSFWKHEPPKPTDDLRNLGPMRESTPIAYATSDTSAPVASHSAEIELIDEMRCARKALAVSLEVRHMSAMLRVPAAVQRAVQCQRRLSCWCVGRPDGGGQANAPRGKDEWRCSRARDRYMRGRGSGDTDMHSAVGSSVAA